METTRFSTVQEIAAMLRVSKMSVYRMIDRGELPSVRVGRNFRIPTKAVWDYLHRQYINPNDVPRSNELDQSLLDGDSPTLRVVK